MRGSMFAPLPERDFLSGHEAVASDHEQNGGEGCFERSIGVLCNHFPRPSDKPARIVMRMQALLGILDHPVMKAWKMEGLPSGGLYIEKTVLRVAARHPITATDKDWFFEPESFMSEILKRSKRAGRA